MTNIKLIQTALVNIEEWANLGHIPSYLGLLPSFLGRLPSYLGRLPLSVNLTSATTYHLTTANNHSQPGLHDFGCGVKLCKMENLPQTVFSLKFNKTVWHFKMVPGR